MDRRRRTVRLPCVTCFSRRWRPIWSFCLIPEIRLSSQVAVTLVMRLHKLTTNASKYGALHGCTSIAAHATP